MFEWFSLDFYSDNKFDSSFNVEDLNPHTKNSPTPLPSISDITNTSFTLASAYTYSEKVPRWDKDDYCIVRMQPNLNCRSGRTGQLKMPLKSHKRLKRNNPELYGHTGLNSLKSNSSKKRRDHAHSIGFQPYWQQTDTIVAFNKSRMIVAAWFHLDGLDYLYEVYSTRIFTRIPCLNKEITSRRCISWFTFLVKLF